MKDQSDSNDRVKKFFCVLPSAILKQLLVPRSLPRAKGMLEIYLARLLTRLNKGAVCSHLEVVNNEACNFSVVNVQLIHIMLLT